MGGRKGGARWNLYGPAAAGAAPPANVHPNSVALYRAIKRLKLDVAQHVATYGNPVPIRADRRTGGGTDARPGRRGIRVPNTNNPSPAGEARTLRFVRVSHPRRQRSILIGGRMQGAPQKEQKQCQRTL